MDTPSTAGAKADFSSIYTAPDPRPYYTTLAELDYQIPGTAMGLVQRALEAMGGEPQILDLACSYGINGAILRTGTPYDELQSHYADPALADLSTDELRQRDREQFCSSVRQSRVVRGLDASAPAVQYAVDVGYLSEGWAEDLESDEPSAQFAAGVAGTGLITCTGGIGYLGVPTFARVLGVLDDPHNVWLMSFVLRMYSFEQIAAECERYGLVTEQLPGVLRQRRFADEGEQRTTIEAVRSRGIDPEGYESEGWYVADAFLTRPASAVRERPLESLFA
ncbi:hypothetical protein EK0264_17600 [Epidermidibacterium keratini]|uniref:Class I SAM-dependent methyltransferase n=1 Tax=Epidermidibacterium keratini TaxID=1891644 RepID=A0A7L4YT08_9ACTN|nr:hypothetical protein [Epidermidibacterium keratini]QHC01909.1 hypothetical protein EK0264_17600 [Epidermidibacterium keratini]